MRALTLALLIGLAAATAQAATAVTLKPQIFDTDGKVTLGELFDGAGAAGEVPVATRMGSSVVLDAGAVQSLALRAGLVWSNAQGIRRIVVRQGAAPSQAAPAARGNVEVLTYARSLSSGDIVQPEDLVWAKAAAAPASAPADADQVIGMEARRPLREGAAVSLRDVSAPEVVKTGDTVMVTWSDGAITLTLQAKATKAAAVGETVTLQNPASRKIIEAVVTGPGAAVSGPQARQMAAAQYALR